MLTVEDIVIVFLSAWIPLCRNTVIALPGNDGPFCLRVLDLRNLTKEEKDYVRTRAVVFHRQYSVIFNIMYVGENIIFGLRFLEREYQAPQVFYPIQQDPNGENYRRQLLQHQQQSRHLQAERLRYNQQQHQHQQQLNQR